MRRTATMAILALALMTLVGCATSNSVTLNPSASTHAFKSAYLVVHGDKSSDMDAAVQRELVGHGLQVKAGPDVPTSRDIDVIVRYTEDWKWDLSMYLRALYIQVYDAAGGTLLATGSWKNSAFHGFHSADDVVKQVVDDIFAKLEQSRQKG